ncbi:MAG TPA: hypothetical protein QGH10_04215 [Armatimonadota bacterium]|nr:hypothetical protein [Armatimonadota bacterium]
MTMTYRFAVLALLLVLASTIGVQRAAQAGDTGRILAGLAAGALVYELLDDDDCCCNTGYACSVHSSRRHNYSRRSNNYNYNTSRYDDYGPRRSTTVIYRDGGYIPLGHRYAPSRGHRYQSYSQPSYGRRGRAQYSRPRRYCR